MNMKVLLTVFSLSAALSLPAFEVENVSARSRWPWNGLIDVDYEITGGEAGDVYVVDVYADFDAGAKKLVARTYGTEPLGAAGRNHVIWNFAKDCPDVMAPDMRVSVTATKIDTPAELYCVIDLSRGPTATHYPVHYRTTGPGHVQGAMNEPCQTTEMWLKRVVAGTFPFRGTDLAPKGNYTVKLTKPLYAALFECTQQQWYQVTGTWPSKFANAEFRASRPVENITHADILGQVNWPDDKTVSADSFVGKLRARTGLSTFNLPTECQLEYVSRAGSTKTASNTHGRYNMSTTDYTVSTNSGTACVGSYLANNWGFYDVVGNVAEWTLDTYASEEDLQTLYASEIADPGYVTDPEGPANATSPTDLHTTRGGSYKSNSNNTRLISRASANAADAGNGARFVVVCE